MKELQRCINTGGVLINVRQWNRDKRPTIILVHGYPDCSHVWDNIAALLAEDFHVVAYDVRGAGLSDAPPNIRDYSLARLSADFKAVIDAVSLNRAVHVVAHDWGSIQSWESVTDPALKSRIASFTTLSGPCLDHVGYWFRGNLKPNRANLSKLARQLAHSWYIGWFHLPAMAPMSWENGLADAWPQVVEFLDNTEIPPNDTQQRDGKNGIKLYRANMLPRLLLPRERYTQIPVQVLVAEDDPFVPPQLLEGLSKWAPNLWQRSIKAGHWLPISHPDWVASQVASFVNMLDSGNSRKPTIETKAESQPTA